MRKSNSSRNAILIAVIITIVLSLAFISGCSCACGDKSETPELSSEIVEPGTNEDYEYVIDSAEIETTEETSESTSTTYTSQDTTTEKTTESTTTPGNDGFSTDSSDALEPV